jgi:hypothetical protein
MCVLMVTEMTSRSVTVGPFMLDGLAASLLANGDNNEGNGGLYICLRNALRRLILLFIPLILLHACTTIFRQKIFY